MSVLVSIGVVIAFALFCLGLVECGYNQGKNETKTHCNELIYSNGVRSNPPTYVCDFGDNK